MTAASPRAAPPLEVRQNMKILTDFATLAIAGGLLWNVAIWKGQQDTLADQVREDRKEHAQEKKDLAATLEAMKIQLSDSAAATREVKAELASVRSSFDDWKKAHK